MDDATSSKLLLRVRDRGDASAWREFYVFYGPLLERWLRRYALAKADVDDVVQDVMHTLVRELPQFQYDRQRGSFRGWLRTVLAHRLLAWRRSRPHVIASDDDLMNLSDPTSSSAQEWEQEWQHYTLARLLAQVQPDFAPATFAAFREVMLDGRSVEETAAKLGISVNAVRLAKCRVLRRLREAADAWRDRTS